MQLLQTRDRHRPDRGVDHPGGVNARCLEGLALSRRRCPPAALAHIIREGAMARSMGALIFRKIHAQKATQMARNAAHKDIVKQLIIVFCCVGVLNAIPGLKF
jgi:hypothetical protein